jgi:hypothetical protein
MDNEAILPLLKPADWNLRDDMVCRPLAAFPASGMPFVAYGWDHPHTFELLAHGGANGATPASLDPLALRHLRARSASWDRVDVKLGWFSKLRLLVCTDDFLAAEHILDAEFLREAQRQLRAEMLAVGVPRRGMLMVCDGARPKEDLERFCAAVGGQYHRAEAPPITSTVFAALDGAIVGHLEDGGLAAGMKAHVADVADAIYVQSITLEADGARRAVICAGGEPLELLAGRIRREFATLVRKYGVALRAEVAIIPDLTPQSVELDAWMPALATGLSELAGELGLPHDVRVGYGQP